MLKMRPHPQRMLLQDWLETALLESNGRPESCLWLNIIAQRVFDHVAELSAPGGIDLQALINARLAAGLMTESLQCISRVYFHYSPLRFELSFWLHAYAL